MTNLEAQIKTINEMNKNTVKMLDLLNKEFYKLKKGTKILLKSNMSSSASRRVKEEVGEFFIKRNNITHKFNFYFIISEYYISVKVRQMLKVENNWYVYKDDEIHLTSLKDGKWVENFNIKDVVSNNNLNVKLNAKTVIKKQLKRAKLKEELSKLNMELKHFN